MDDLSQQLEKLRRQYESMPEESRFDNVGSLSRYFFWSDKMRYDFDSLLRDRGTLDDFAFDEYCHIYLSYWYGGLYVLIEGWRELNLKDQKIDELLSSPYVDLLRRYRNAVFHFQRKYSDKRFMELMLAGTESVTWVRQLHTEFGRFFATWWQTNTKKRRNIS